MLGKHLPIWVNPESPCFAYMSEVGGVRSVSGPNREIVSFRSLARTHARSRREEEEEERFCIYELVLGRMLSFFFTCFFPFCFFPAIGLWVFFCLFAFVFV